MLLASMLADSVNDNDNNSTNAAASTLSLLGYLLLLKQLVSRRETLFAREVGSTFVNSDPT